MFCLLCLKELFLVWIFGSIFLKLWWKCIVCCAALFVFKGVWFDGFCFFLFYFVFFLSFWYIFVTMAYGLVWDACMACHFHYCNAIYLSTSIIVLFLSGKSAHSNRQYQTSLNSILHRKKKQTTYFCERIWLPVIILNEIWYLDIGLNEGKNFCTH